MNCYRCGMQRVGPPAIHACLKSDIDAKNARDRGDWATHEFRPVDSLSDRDAALSCRHALESACMELRDSRAYADNVSSQTTRDAIDDAITTVLRAQEMLRITIKRLPTQ